MIVPNSDYLEQLEIIRKIRDTIKVNDEINLPQICVIGDQSSGKSSFLSRLTGVKFPTAAKMCTKAAVVVTCNRDVSLMVPRYEIEDWKNPGAYYKIDSTEKAIQTTQNELLQKAAGSNGNNWDADENAIVSEQSIKLRVSSKDVIDIIVVDLPGIQHAGNTKDSILALIEKNIAKPETLNLIVSEAKQDAELTKAIEIAEKYDPDHSRTIRVLSKFDNFDTLETQHRAVQLIKDGKLESTTTTAIPGRLNLGPHAIISVGKDGKLRSDRESEYSEKKQLTEAYKVPPDRAGIDTLKERLQPLFASLIKQYLPKMKQSVSDRLNETNLTLETVGAEPKSTIQIVNSCHQVMKDSIDELEKVLSNKCFLPVKEKISQTKTFITSDFATEGFEMNSFHCALFQGERSFEEAAKKIQTLWKPIVDEFVKQSAEITFEASQCLHKHASTNIYGRLISIIQSEHQEYIEKNVLSHFRGACEEALRQEGTYSTTNHYFDSKFREDEICPNELVDAFKLKVEAVLRDNSKSPPYPNQSSYRLVESHYLVQCLRDAKTEIASQQVHTNLLDTQKNRVFSAVKAHFDVEKKTFTDILLKNLKCIMMEGHTAFVEKDLLRSIKIMEHAKEDKNVTKLRKELLSKKDRLKECMALLHNVPFPPKIEEDDEKPKAKNVNKKRPTSGNGDDNQQSSNDSSSNDSRKRKADNTTLHLTPRTKTSKGTTVGSAEADGADHTLFCVGGNVRHYSIKVDGQTGRTKTSVVKR